MKYCDAVKLICSDMLQRVGIGNYCGSNIGIGMHAMYLTIEFYQTA